MTNEELQSKTITWLRFPLAVAIVLNHAIGDTNVLRAYISHIDYSFLSGVDAYNLVRYFFSDILARIATPCFCIFSGFLFFYKCKVWNLNIYFDKIKRKSRTLVVPYVLWNIIAVVILAIPYLFKGNLSAYLSELWGTGIFKLFWNYHGGLYPYNIPLWFLRDLIIVAFLSPLVYYFVKYTKVYSLVILGFFYFTDIWFPVVSIRALFYFTLGAYFSIHGKNMIMELRKGMIPWLCSAIITMIATLYFQGTDTFAYAYVLFAVSACITTINFVSWLIEHDRVTVYPNLSKTSFFIFSSHILLIGSCSKLLNFVFNSDNSLILTVEYFLTPVICAGMCLGLYFAAKKSAPRLLGILTGSR